jgi:hypothetical protein
MGRVLKMSPGPAPGSRPLAKTMGKIAIPASNATRVSMKAMVMEVLAMEVFCGR